MKILYDTLHALCLITFGNKSYVYVRHIQFSVIFYFCLLATQMLIDSRIFFKSMHNKNMLNKILYFLFSDNLIGDPNLIKTSSSRTTNLNTTLNIVTIKLFCDQWQRRSKFDFYKYKIN